MILIITNKLDPHVDWIIDVLKKRNIDFARFNTEDFPSKTTISWWADKKGFDGEMNLPSGKNFLLSQITACWYRRPLPAIIDREIFPEQAQNFAREESKEFLNFLWNSLTCSWINHPSSIRRAESKILQLCLASECGLSVPKTLMTNDSQKAKEFAHLCNDSIASKVLGRGEIEYQNDYYFIYTHKLSPENLQDLSSVRFAPVIFQKYIDKLVEIRATVFGDKIFACEIHSQDSEQTKEDWRHYDFTKVKHDIHKLPHHVEKSCLDLVKRLDLKFGAIDLILAPNGEYIFLELNPNGQWLWVEHLTDQPMSEALINLLTK